MGAEVGKRAVIGEALAQAGGALVAERAAVAGEQLTLLPVPTRFTGARGAHVAAALDARDRAGRPPGAINKSTKELREYLLARGVHPLQRMMEWMRHTPTSLAAELGCTRLEAFDRLRDLWRDSAPYFAPKLVPTDESGREVPFFQMIVGGQHAHLGAGGGAVPWLDPVTGGAWGASGAVVEASAAPSEPGAEIEQNQALGGEGPPVSHADKSHEDE